MQSFTFLEDQSVHQHALVLGMAAWTVERILHSI